MDEQIRQLESAVALAPEELAPFDALAAAYARAGRFEEMVQLFERRAALLPDDAEAPGWLAAAAGIALTQIKDPGRARALVEKALLLGPRDPAARDAQAQILSAWGDLATLAELYERWAAEGSSAEAADLLSKSADLLAGSLGQPMRAALSLVRAFRYDPSQRQHLAQARALLLACQLPGVALEVLGDERQAFGGEGLAESYGQIAEALCEWPVDFELARKAADAGLALDPGEPRALRTLAKIDQAAATWPEEVRALRARAPEERDRKQAAALYLRAAELHHAFEGPRGAPRIREVLGPCMLLWPAMPQLHDFLERAAQAQGDFAAFERQLERLTQEVQDRPTRVALLARLGQVRLTRLNDRARALAAFARVAELDPARADAMSLAVELYLDEGKVKEAAALWERHLAAVPSPLLQVNVRLRLAELYAAQLGDLARAREHLIEALRADPAAAYVTEPLAHLFADEPDPVRQIEGWERTLPGAPSVAVELERLARIDALLERRGDRAGDRLRYAARALRLAPEVSLADRLLDCADRAGDAGLAAGALRIAAAAAPEASRLPILKRLAQVLERQPGRREEALAQWRQVAEAAPKDGEAQSALERLLGDSGATRALADTLEQRIAAASEPAEKRSLLAHLADEHHQAGRLAEAAEAHRRILALAPDDVSVWEKLQGACRALGRWEEAAEASGRLALLCGDEDEARTWRLRRADLLGKELGRPAEAVEVLLELLAGGDPEVVGRLEWLIQQDVEAARIARALAPHYQARGDFPRAAVALQVLLRSAPAAERYRVYLELARLYEEKLVDSRAALALLLEAGRALPGSEALAEELGRLAMELGAHAEACGLWLEQAGAGGPQAVDLALRAARLAGAGGLEELQGRALEAALAAAPEDAAAFNALVQLLRKRERWAECERLLLPRLERLSGKARAEALLELAGVLEALARPAEAAVTIQEAIALGAEEEPLFPRLARALEAAGKHDELEKVRVRLEGSLGDREGAVKGYAEILSTRPSDPDALASLEAMLDDASLREQAARALVPAFEATQEHRKLVRALEVLAASAKDPAEQVAALRKAAQAYAHHLRQPDLAFAMLARAFRLAPGDAALRLATRRAAEESDSLEVFAEVVGECAEAASGAAAVPLHRELAEICEKRLDDRPGAIAAYQRILEADPQNLDALRGLHRLQRAGEAFAELAETCLRLAEVVYEAQEKAALYREAGALREETLKDLEGAARVYRRFCEVDPRNRDAAEALERVCEKLGRPREHALALEALAKLSEGTACKGHRLRRAAVLETQADAREALDAYAALLREWPNDPAALAGLERLFADEPVRAQVAGLLEPVYRSLGDGRRLAEVLEARLAAAPAGERPKLLAEVASLRETLGEKPLAFALKLRAFREAPQDKSARDELERLAADTGSFEDLAAAYRDELDKNPPDGLALELWRALAQVCADRLGAFDQAASALEEVARRQPNDAQVLEGLARLYRRQNALAELAGTQWRQAALEASPQKKRELLHELASLCEERLSDPAAAIRAYQGLLELGPNDAQALEALHRLFTQAERWEDLAAHMGREVEAAKALGKQEEALELAVRLGRLKLQRLSDPRGALSLFRAVAEQKPGHASAVAALEEMAKGEGPLRTEAALALEPLFAQGGDHQRLVEVLEARAAAAPPTERAVLLRRVAEVYAGPIGSPEMAFVAATRALREAPDDREAVAVAARYAEPAGMGEELEALVAEVLPRATSDEARAELFRTLARLCAGAPASRRRAADAFLRLLEIRPGDAEALEQLLPLLRELGDWETLLEILRRKLAAAEGEARAPLLLAMAEVQEEELRDPAGAIATLNRLLAEVKPDDPVALERLDALCVRQERWVELADVLQQEVALAEAAKDLGHSSPLRLRLAAVREERLLDKLGALALYREILAAKPDHPEAIQRLEALVAREPALDEAAQVLEAAYRGTGSVAQLAQLLETRAAHATEGAEKKRLFAELAVLRAERQNQPEMAFLAFCRAFREDPADREIRKQLERLAADSDSEEELVALYEEALPGVKDEVAASEIAFRTAVLLETKLDRADEALPYYEQALALDVESGVQALPALERMYRAQEAWDKLAEVLRRSAEVTEEPKEKASLLFRLGQILDEKLSHPDRAAEAYEAILRLDAASMPALRGLEKLYEAAQRWDRLYEILQAEKASAPAHERERITSRMAEVAGKGLSNAAQSIELYREVLDKNPRSDAAFAALEGLYESAQRWDDLVEIVRRKLSITVDPREIVRLSDKLGRVLFENLGRADDAAAAFKAVLDRDPRHRHALESLRDLYDRQGATDELVTMLRRLIPVQDDPAGVRQVRLKLAEVLSKAGRKEEALDSARRALDVESVSKNRAGDQANPGPGAGLAGLDEGDFSTRVEPQAEGDLVRAEELFRALGSYPDAVKAMELRAGLYEQAGEVERAVATLDGVAELQAAQLKKPEQALLAYDRILQVDPKNRIAFDKLRAVAREVGDWRRYTQTTDRFLPSLASAAEQLAMLKDVALVQVQQLGEQDMAFLTLCRALHQEPTDAEVRERLGALAGETESWEELATVYEEVAESAPKGPLAETLYAELARIQDAHLDEPEAAESSLRKILEFDPANRTALEVMGQMHARRGRDTEHVAALEQKLEVTGSIEERKQVLREIARVYDERIKNPAEAIAALGRALDLDADRQTIDVLAALLRREKRFEALAQLLVRARDLAAQPAERAELQREVAELHERELGDDEAAIAGYRLALELDPAHLAAMAALERLYTKLDRPAELLGVYERQREVAQDPKERIKILFKTSAIWEDKYQNLANADACFQAIVELDPHNLGAIKGLERLKRAQEKWEELVQVYDRHLALVGGVDDQVELLLAQGEVWYHQLSRVDRAAEVFNAAHQLDPSSKGAMHALGVLYERSGNWPFALEMIAREAEIERGPAAVELYHRLGKINEDMLLDAAAAKAAYQRALALDATFLPSLRALKGLFHIDGDWASYIQTLTREARATLDPEEKTRAWVAVGDFHREHGDDRQQAAEAYEEALKVTEDCLEAARPLADIYVAQEGWERAEKMLDIVARRLGERTGQAPDAGKELCRQLYRLGYVCEKLGKSKKALEAYRRAYELDATYLPALEGLGNLLVAAEELDEANKVYQTILIQHRDNLTDLEVVEIYSQLGEINLKLKATDRALNHFEKALAIDPHHEASQRAMVALCEDLGQYDKALAYRRKLAEVLEGEERFGMWAAIGKLCRDQLHDPFGAIDAFVAALRVQPDHLATLDQILQLYRDTHQGPRAVEILERILAHPDVEQDPSAKKKGYFALGEIFRDELKDDEKAVEAWSRCLDIDPKLVQAFSAIENLLTARKQWSRLEEAYALMIRRLPKTEDTHAARMALWRTLAELYQRVLKNPDAAMMAYEVVAKSNPDDVAAQEKFAALAAERPSGQEKAIAAYRQALPATTSPGKVASALAKLHALRKEYDESYVAAQVVTHLLGEGGAEEGEILHKLAPYAKRREVAQKAMTDRMWTELLFHPKVKGPLGEILALLQTQAGSLYAKKHGQHGIDVRRHRIDLSSSIELAINAYKYVLRVLSMDAMELYSPFLIATRERIERKGQGEPPPDPAVFLELCHTWPLCLKAGGVLFKDSNQKELHFFIAKTLAFSRPELALARLLPVERLEAVLQGALALVAPTFRLTADPRLVEQERRALDKALTDPAKGALARLARTYFKAQALGDVRAFIEGAELTANRAGVLLAGQVDTAKAALEKDAGMATRLPVRSKIRDLMVFCLSVEYTQLRKALGVNVEVQLPGRQARA